MNRKRTFAVVLEAEEAEAAVRAYGRAAADGDEDLVDAGDVDGGDEPAAGEPVVADVRVAGAGRAHLLPGGHSERWLEDL